MADPKSPKAENPKKHTGIRLTDAKKKAAGMPAVIASLQHLKNETGLKRGMKVLTKLNQKAGIDCPGCAWPDPDDERSKLGEYCENGVKAIAEEATSKALFADFFEQNSIQHLSELSDYELGKKGRIAQPMYLPRGADHYEAISWDEAFQKIGAKLKSLDDPNEAIFYTSGRTSNEAAFLYQLFVRAYGTNNLPDCSNMCHESSGRALGETLGIGKGSVKLEDFYEAEVIIIMGQNPGTNHPRMLTALQKAKKKGAIIISINPLKETGLISFANPQHITGMMGSATVLTDHYLQVTINGDMPLLQLINKELLAHEAANPGTTLDKNFIENKTSGFQSYEAHLQALDGDMLKLQCGISEKQLATVISILAQKQKIIVCWAMGLTQHVNAVDTIKEVVNLLLLKGSIGKPGAGTCPVRGHSNVQGDRTVGIHERPPQRLLDSIEKVFGFKPPQEHGYDVVHSINAMHDDKAKVFFAMGGNFLSATPDTLYTAEALQKCELTVQVSTKLNRSHLVCGKEAIILPCLSRTDKDDINGEVQFVTVENSMGVVHSTKGVLEPVSSDLLSEPQIVCELAKASLKDSTIDWNGFMEHYDVIRDSIEATIPGFDNYNERVRVPGGFYLPNCARDNEYNTPEKKAIFTQSIFKPVEIREDELMMMTVRSHDQFNTTIYGLDDRYRGVLSERRVVFMNQEDMRSRNIAQKEIVNLSNDTGGTLRVAENFIAIEYDIPKGCVATYFPEANVLVPIHMTAKKSNTPASKSVPIRIKKMGNN